MDGIEPSNLSEAGSRLNRDEPLGCGLDHEGDLGSN